MVKFRLVNLLSRGPASLSSARGACVFDTYTTIGDEPIEVYDRGNPAATMSAIYDIGEINTAYDRIPYEMKINGNKLNVRQSGCNIDRCSQDIAVDVRF